MNRKTILKKRDRLLNTSLSKTIDANLQDRIDIITAAEDNFLLQKELTKKCQGDLIFWINFFVWVKNPKDPKAPDKPFVLYPKQKDIALEIEAEIEDGRSSLTEKSRETGMSFLHLAVYLKRFLWVDGSEFLLGSLKQEDVDDWTVSSLMGKARFMLHLLPFWMMPLKYIERIHSTFLKLVNPDNDASIVGRATTKDFGRSGRKTAVLLDEHASVGTRVIEGIETALQETANTIHRVSTHKGITTFKKIRDKKKCPVHVIHWTQMPDKCKGLYYLDEVGKKVMVPDLPLEKRSPYGFYIKRNGKVSKHQLLSPWYEGKKDDYLTIRDLKQELDISALGSGYCRFNANMIEQGSGLCKDGVRGYLVNNGTDEKPKIKFMEVETGAPFEIEVWKFPTKPYWSQRSFIGADTAEGLEKGDYCSGDVIIKSADGLSGYHAAALHGHFEPDIFSDKLFELGMWYDGGAFMGVERNKDGLGVLLRLKRHYDYRRLFTEKTQDQETGDRETGRLGFLTSSTNKKHLITGDMDRSFRDGELVSHSIGHYSEMSTFENKKGKLEASGDNHDDRVISLAIAWHVAQLGGRPSEILLKAKGQKGPGKRRRKKRFSTTRY